ncbi:helix-turn-helix domain-containing protein [Streptococcus castoreus]|uniref:helix-turn-helix domain-containing protein n=1 Tax=Streptococcus castoreus TaxID=254786 RepID=UPI0003FC09A7|nr:helix-turn-helix domain-containing protein [Streptococcus castoreus]
MELKDYFPEVQEGAFPLADQDWISIENGGRYLYIPKSCLTEREQLLLGLGREGFHQVGQQSPWYHYLIDRKGNLPESFDYCQFIYLNHYQPLSAELVELLTSVIDGVEAVLPIGPTRTAFLRHQRNSPDLLQLLKQLLPTIESDFGLALTIFIGNTWDKLTGSVLRDYFEEENRLLNTYLTQKSTGNLLTFPELMLWSLVSHQPLPTLTQHFSQLLINQKEVADLVQALWQAHGNLVQTAQRLYIHRNSLQYKIDKFAQQSGLYLKNLDDLAFAYLLLLKH